MIQACAAGILVDEEALWFFYTASEELDGVLVLHLVDESDVVEELIDPLPRVEEEPLDCDFSAIWENSMVT